MATNGGNLPVPAPFRLRAALAVPAGWPPDVSPGQVIRAAHVNTVRTSVYAWPGDVDGQNHTLSNVHLVNATGVMLDPTTTAGDLIARGAAGIGRLPIGSAGQVLTVDSTQPQGMRWAPLPPSGVSSVFGRQGAIVAQAGDYTVAQITGAMANPTISKGDLIARSATAIDRLPIGADGQVLTADAASALGVKWGAPAVSSVFGRTGNVTPQTGDYTAMMVTNAVSTAGSYPDPPWIPNYSYSKLLGVPTTFPPAAHTHSAAEIVSGVLSTARLGTGVADATVYLRGDGTWAAAGTGGGGGVISVFGRAGNVIAQAGDYTAAMVTGAVTDPTTTTGDLIVRNNVNALARLPIGANGQVLQTDTSLSVGMKWTSIEATVQTPWVTDVNAANFQLVNVRRLGVGVAAPNYGIDVAGDINYTGVLRVNGAPVSFGGAQTPWTSDINAANFSLSNVKTLGIGVAPPQSAPLQVASHTPGPAGSLAVQDLDANAGGNPVLMVTGIGSEGTRCWTVGNRGGATFGQNFYVWNDRASNILIGTNSTERMRITAAGHMGVWNTMAGLPDADPAVHLVVSGDSTAMGQITAAINTTTAGAIVGTFNFANYNIAAVDKRVAAIMGIIESTKDSAALAFFTWNVGNIGERVRITAAGNVGVGTLGPISRLAIKQSTDGYDGGLQVVRAGTNNSAALYIGGDNQLYLQANNAAGGFVAVQFGGNVGIGTASALGKLHVDGTAAGQSAASYLYYTGNSFGAYPSGTFGMAIGNNFAAGQAVSIWNANTSATRALEFVQLISSGVSRTLMTLLSNGGIELLWLPSASPGAGSKQLWYDPADGNRVKYAA